jgi:ribose transport system permease protein
MTVPDIALPGPRRAAAARVAALRERVSMRDLAILGVFALLFVTLSIASPVFLSKTNLLNILDQSAPVGIIAVGTTIVVIAGGFDLSTGALYSLAAVLSGMVVNSTGFVAGLGVAAVVGLAAGVLNGTLVGGLRINPLLATLGTSLIFAGLAVVATGGFQVSIDDANFLHVGAHAPLGLTWVTWALVAICVVAGVLLRRTRFGRYVFAVGGNAEAARLSGVRVGAIIAAAFAFGGLCAGLAGYLATSRVGIAQADSGVGLELQALAAVFVGGTSIAGGEGAIWRTVIGVYILALIQNGFNLLNFSAEYQPIIQGSIIIVAVAIETWTRRRGD